MSRKDKSHDTLTKHALSAPPTRPPTVIWIPGPSSSKVDGHLQIIDQRLLPTSVKLLALQTAEEVWHAIRTLAVRGAPAIGVTAAFGMVLSARTVAPSSQAAHLIKTLTTAAAYLKSARPTAVNLEWAVDHMLRVAITERAIGVRQLQIRLLHEAQSIRTDDITMCLAIGKHGLPLIQPNSGILTHCNAGALATSDHGTALAPLYEAHRRGVPFHVFADETRPLLQGSRLTAWELAASGIDVTVICDNMAGLVMRQKKVQLVIVGADRIARNGDTANKIGTYSLALLARAHKIPFYIAAPATTFDLSLPTGEKIPIEERPPEEITHGFGKATAPEKIKAYNPAFDVTPADLITAIITQRGIISPVNETTVRAMIDQ